MAEHPEDTVATAERKEPLPPEHTETAAETVAPKRTAHPDERWVAIGFRVAWWLSLLAWALAFNPASLLIGGLAFAWVRWMQNKKRLLWTRVGRMGSLVFGGVTVAVSFVVVWGVHFNNQCNFCASQLIYAVQILWVIVLAFVCLFTPREIKRPAVAPTAEAGE